MRAEDDGPAGGADGPVCGGMYAEVVGDPSERSAPSTGGLTRLARLTRLHRAGRSTAAAPDQLARFGAHCAVAAALAVLAVRANEPDHPSTISGPGTARRS